MKRILTQHMDDHDTQWWVSNPDNDDEFLPVNQPVQPGMANDVRKLFAGERHGKRLTCPLKFAKRFLSPVFRNEILLEEEVAP